LGGGGGDVFAKLTKSGDTGLKRKKKLEKVETIEVDRKCHKSPNWKEV